MRSRSQTQRIEDVSEKAVYPEAQEEQKQEYKLKFVLTVKLLNTMTMVLISMDSFPWFSIIFPFYFSFCVLLYCNINLMFGKSKYKCIITYVVIGCNLGQYYNLLFFITRLNFWFLFMQTIIMVGQEFWKLIYAPDFYYGVFGESKDDI